MAAPDSKLSSAKELLQSIEKSLEKLRADDKNNAPEMRPDMLEAIKGLSRGGVSGGDNVNIQSSPASTPLAQTKDKGQTIAPR